MNTMLAFLMGETNRGRPLMVFDWNKAARRIKEEKASEAWAGLAGDWEYTGGSIWTWEGIVPEEDTYVYLASTWATPELNIDGVVESCFVMEDEVPDDWGGDPAKVYWPESARKIALG